MGYFGTWTGVFSFERTGGEGGGGEAKQQIGGRGRQGREGDVL